MPPTATLVAPVTTPAVATGLIFGRTDELRTAEHEQVVFCHDRATGLNAIIAIHDTTLGPALGGTRIYPYACEADAVTDVLRLSRGMTYKAALAGLKLGGGKAVIIGDPHLIKSRDLLLAYGRFVNSLGGRYITAGDVGSTANDLDVIAEATPYVVGKNIGGSGDSGLSTAFGVFCAMRAAADHRFGPDGLVGRTVAIEGLGKVGFRLAGLLAEAGVGRIQAVDVDEAAFERLAAAGLIVERVPSALAADADIYAPCALGASLSMDSITNLRASVVCGAANNQLATDEVADALQKRGILWVPDYLANAGGLVQVNGELENSTPEQVKAKVSEIYQTTAEIMAQAERFGVTTHAAADAVVESRLAAARAEQAR